MVGVAWERRLTVRLGGLWALQLLEQEKEGKPCVLKQMSLSVSLLAHLSWVFWSLLVLIILVNSIEEKRETREKRLKKEGRKLLLAHWRRESVPRLSLILKECLPPVTVPQVDTA